MSSHVRLRTLKFCTNNINTIENALNILSLNYNLQNNQILLDDLTIKNSNEYYYVEIEDNNNIKKSLFNKINSKIAEYELMVRQSNIARNIDLKKLAKENEEMYKVRQLNRENEMLEYEKKQLELEQQNFIEAKKQAIINKAKDMGYIVKENSVDGIVKLKLIKRVY